MTNITAEFLTRREVADIFRVSQHSIIRWERDGRLPAVRLGAGSVRYRRADVQAFLECCGKMPTPASN